MIFSCNYFVHVDVLRFYYDAYIMQIFASTYMHNYVYTYVFFVIERVLWVLVFVNNMQTPGKKEPRLRISFHLIDQWEFSWLLIDGGEPHQWWVVPPLGGSPGLYKKHSWTWGWKEATNPGSSMVSALLHASWFLPGAPGLASLENRL